MKPESPGSWDDNVLDIRNERPSIIRVFLEEVLTALAFVAVSVGGAALFIRLALG